MCYAMDKDGVYVCPKLTKGLNMLHKHMKDLDIFDHEFCMISLNDSNHK